MKDKIKKRWNRKWSNWEIHTENKKYDVNRNTNWKIITTLKRVSNDGLIEYKIVKNY